ncbi:pseudouridine synthase [Gayadomonas joobiniege]|uniref:pseudouridine synthase n=1 Tax=Gayadomonas joobiniege TaxID=1234606 RepID=UPI0003773F6B|nr:pseudouridine synthase [Gayadomonas joobiniege]
MHCPIELVYEHADFYVFNKPAGCDFHDDQGQSGFFSLVKQAYPSETLYPVHRLDKETSGLLIVARHLSAEHALKHCFQNHLINKYYLAIGPAKARKKQGCIKGDMQRSRNKSWRLLKSQQHAAITYFKSFSLTPGKRLYLLKPISGKTHQLRVMMKSIAAPIDGDCIYKGENSSRLHLHAAYLDFMYSGARIQIVALPQQAGFSAITEFVKHQPWLTEPWALDWPAGADCQ